MSIDLARIRRPIARSIARSIPTVPLRWALTVPFVLLTVGATTLVGYLSHRDGEQTVADLAGQLMQEKGNQTVLYLERSLAVPHLINQLNADSIRLGQLPGFETTNPTPLEEFFWVQLLRFPDVTSIAMGNNRGGMVGSGRRLVPGPVTMNVYRTAQFAKGKYTLSITNAEGEIVETKTISENYDARTRPWYDTPAKAGEATWSPIYQYISDLQVLGISAGLPVYTDAGSLRGILTADINLKGLSDFLAGLDVSPSGQVFIVERSGLLVASSTNQPIAQMQAGEAQRINAEASADPTMRATMAQLNARFDDLGQIGEIQQFTIEPSQSAKWVRVIPFQDRHGLDWLIVMVVPESDFMAAIQANQATTFLLCLLTLGGAIGLGLLAADRLIVRFADLNRASRELAAGNLDRRLLTNGLIGELNGLAHTFNQMADRLQHSFDRVQSDLAASEARFSTIFHASPDPIAISSFREGRFLEVNDALLAFYGYSRSEVVGRTVFELNLWRDLEERDRYRKLLEQQGSVRNLEVELQTKSGAVKTVLLSVEVRSLDGQECVIAVYRDFSDRKQTEEALRHSEALNRAIFNALPDLILRMNQAGTYLSIKHTNAFPTLFPGLREGENIRNVLPPDVTQARLRAIAAALQTGEMQVSEYPLWVEGHYVWQEARVIPLDGDEVLIIIRDLTQRKQFEDALRQSEANLLQAQRIAHLGSWEFDPLTQKSSWSEELFRIHGLDPSQSEPAYEDLLERIPPDDRARLTMAVNRAIADGTAYEVEHRLHRSDGTLRYIVSKGQAMLNDRQQVVKLYGTVLDITDRKKAEIALQQSEERFREIAETVHDIFYIFSADLRHLLYVSPAYETISGYVREKLYADLDFWEKCMHPDDRAMVHQAWAVISERGEFRAEYRTIRSDGEIRWIKDRAFPIYGEDGQVLRVIGIAEDFTDRRHVEEALRQSEERFCEIAHTINQLFFVRSIPSGEYLYVSPGYEKLWGRSLESLYEHPDSWLDSVHPADRDRVLESVRQQAKGDVVRREYRLMQANGAVRWIATEISIVRDETGVPVRLIGLADDITDRKQLEQSLRSQAEEARLFATITQNIRQSLDLDQILATTVIEVQQTLKADRALIFRLHSDGSGQVIQEAVLPNYPVTHQMRWEDEHFAIECYEHYRQGKPRIVADVAIDEWAACLTEFMQEIGVKSKIVAPIVRTCGESSSVWGLLIVHACADYRQWQVAEADFLQQICNQLAIAIDQANLYQQLQVELAERKQAEAILKEREAMLRAIGDNLPKGYIYQRVYEPEKGFYYSYVSAGIERLLGITPEAVLNDRMVMRSVGFEEDLAIADRAAQESLEKLTPIELQMRNRSPEGKIRWSSIRSVPRRTEDGRTVWDGLEVDITDFKQIEAALRASEEQFRRAFDDAPIGVSLSTQTGQYIKVNSCYCNLLGYSEAELLSLTFQDITHPADLEADVRGFERMLAGEIGSFQITKRYITKQGIVVPVLLNAAPIRDQDGQLLYVVAHTQDIRDRLKVERMKDEFISVVSHELRTPLTSIRGALGILGSGVFNDRPEKAQHMLNIAINNSDRLVALVNDILTLERLESGKVELVMEPCRVAELMQQAIDSVQAIADQSNITISCTSIAETLWAASGAIVQTLTNLLSNAIKFSTSGDTVWLEAAVATEGKFFDPHILFTVKDQGRGIPEDKLDVIFEQFQQVDASDSREKGGTGLGLTICKRIVQQHSGQIWVESSLGAGSTFYVALPFAGKTSD